MSQAPRSAGTPSATGQSVLRAVKHRTLEGYMPGDAPESPAGALRSSGTPGLSGGRGPKSPGSGAPLHLSPIPRGRASPSPPRGARGLALSGSGASPAGRGGVGAADLALPAPDIEVFEHLDVEDFAQRLYAIFSVEDPSVVLQEVEKLRSAEEDLRAQLAKAQAAYGAQAKTHRQLTRQLAETQRSVDSLRAQADSLRAEAEDLRAWGAELLSAACRELRAAGLRPRVSGGLERLALPEPLVQEARDARDALMALETRWPAEAEGEPEALASLGPGQRALLALLLYSQLVDHSSLATAQLGTAQAENARLLEDIAALRQRQLELARENHDKTEEADGLALRLGEAEEELGGCREALAQAEGRLGRAEAEAAALREEASRAETDFRARRAALEAQLASASAALQERESALRDREGEAQRLGGEVARLEAERAGLQVSLAGLEASLAEAGRDRDTLRAELAETARHRDDLEGVNARLQSDMAEVMRELSDARKSALGLSQRAADAQALSQAREGEVSRLLGEAGALRAEREAGLAAIQSLEARVAALAGRCEELEAHGAKGAQDAQEGHEGREAQPGAESGGEDRESAPGEPGESGEPGAREDPEGHAEHGDSALSGPGGELGTDAGNPADPASPVSPASPASPTPRTIFDLTKLIFTCIGDDPAQLKQLSSRLVEQARLVESGASPAGPEGAPAAEPSPIQPSPDGAGPGGQSHCEPSALFDPSFADQALRSLQPQFVDFDVILRDVQRRGRFQPSRSIYASFVK